MDYALMCSSTRQRGQRRQKLSFIFKMCRFADNCDSHNNSCEHRDHYKQRNSFRHFPYLPTIFEVEDETETDNSTIQNDVVEFITKFHASENRSNNLGKGSAQVLSTADVFLSKHSAKTICIDRHRSIKGLRVPRQSGRMRLANQDLLEKQLGIAAWMKFFGQ